MITRDEALQTIRSKVPNTNLVNHMIAVGAIMEKLAEHFAEPVDKWWLAGILHDIDLGETDDPAVHGILGAEWLSKMGLAEDICQAVKAHADHAPRETRLAKTLYAVDQLSGLIIACALVKGRKLQNVTPKIVMKRFKEKRFAAGANRENIMTCEEIGLTLQQFVEISLDAMQGISSDIGL
jgi:putative nucleotidyltransferase with HDIG domain